MQLTAFDYVSVLLSIVVSLAFTHLLVGVARIIRADKGRLSLIQIGWIGILLFSCVDYWFSIWQLHTSQTWTLGFVIFLLLLATALYLTCWLLIPERFEDGIDLVEFDTTNRRKYLGGFIIYMSLGTVANLDIAHFQGAIAISSGLALLAAIAWLFKEPRLQYAVLVAMYALIVYYSLHFIPQL